MLRNFSLLTFLLICLNQAVHAQPLLSGFAGSVEKGVYENEYAAFFFAKAASQEPEFKQIEGALLSRIFTKPAEKSNLELFRSYQQELQNGGFTILLAATPSDYKPTNLLRRLYRDKGNALDKRRYIKSADSVSQSDLSRLATFGEYYLSAVKTTAGSTLHVALVLSSEHDLYLIDEMKSAAMEDGTVILNLEAMRQAIADTGKIAVYDIYFKTGSAEITVNSAQALKVIADYLAEDSGDFYIVGHTDDTGPLSSNLRLSEQRAVTVKQVLMRDYGIAVKRLETGGVGPLAPAASNASQAGRALNRRVEIVKRLSKD